MSTTMSCFRLFDLPLDLLELLTLYFEEKEAVKLLTVSSNFHEIFARSVWRTITINTVCVAEPVRSSAYARYGHLVRSIDLAYNESEFDPHDWAQLFPNTTSMAFDIPIWMEDDDKQMFMDAIASLHGLRSLKIQMEISTPPFDLDILARVMMARHHDSSKQRLREVTILFINNDDDDDDEEQEKLWTNLRSFVQTLSPLRPSISLQIDMSRYYCTNVPNPVQMETLRPYLTALPDLSIVANEYGCMALHNQQVLSPSGTCDDPLVFGRLRTLTIDVCCASRILFDYSDFTPAKFPAIEWMEITERPCRHQTEEDAGSAIQVLLTQEWPELKDVRIHGSARLLFSALEKMAKLNPQLTDLAIEVYRNTVGTDGVLMLERVAGQLPRLTSFSLRGESSILIDSSWLQTANLVNIRSSKLESIAISKTILTPRLFEVLLALPNLCSMSFNKCILIEPKLFKSVFKKHQQTAKEGATVGISSLTISIPRDNISWPTELVFELIACLPHLKSCTIDGDASLENAIREKYPHIRLIMDYYMVGWYSPHGI
ncbi:hypothetical protein GQ42DRAFT_161309 [Ramicandelaber brevisporus]|nr:hypothetical protein GQ42DRAFT_161309 [Ramicandelaber brevisporus]